MMRMSMNQYVGAGIVTATLLTGCSTGDAVVPPTVTATSLEKSVQLPGGSTNGDPATNNEPYDTPFYDAIVVGYSPKKDIHTTRACYMETISIEYTSPLCEDKPSQKDTDGHDPLAAARWIVDISSCYLDRGQLKRIATPPPADHKFYTDDENARNYKLYKTFGRDYVRDPKATFAGKACINQYYATDEYKNTQPPSAHQS